MRPTAGRKLWLAFRIRPEVKARIDQAAALLGLTVTDFVVSTLRERADEVIEAARTVRLSDRDRDRFLAALRRPPEPIPELIETLERQRERGVQRE